MHTINQSQYSDRRPDADLIGMSDGRWRLSTPALVVDLDVLEENIAIMREVGERHKVNIRPHCKSHKSIAIANLQMKAGAIGICCATIGEAEVMAAGGVGGLLITSPLVTLDKMERAAALVMVKDLMLVVDNPLNALALSNHMEMQGKTVDVLVDVDPGMKRTGAANQRSALELVELVIKLPSLRYRGLQCYAGHIQHIPDREVRHQIALEILGELRVLCEELRVKGMPPEIVSGSGTGTFEIDATAGVLTELQAGSYLFMDVQYDRVWTQSGLNPPFGSSLFVQSSVVSNNHPGGATCDAGFKHLAFDGGPPTISSGAPEGATYVYYGDEHGRIILSEGENLPLGARLEFIVPHCDPTVNLYDFMHCVRGNALVEIWRVDARGA